MTGSQETVLVGKCITTVCTVSFLRTDGLLPTYAASVTDSTRLDSEI